jgi:hypothetical protein
MMGTNSDPLPQNFRIFIAYGVYLCELIFYIGTIWGLSVHAGDSNGVETIIESIMVEGDDADPKINNFLN